MNYINEIRASILAIFHNNNISQLSLGDPDELDHPTYVIWYDNQGTFYRDPIIQVKLQNTELSFEVDPSDFDNTLTVYEEDIIRKEWWQSLHDNILEILQRDGQSRCPVCGKLLEAHQEYCSDACQQGLSLTQYKHNAYPENNLTDEDQYHKIQQLEEQLQTDQKKLLVTLLNRNGGRITSHPVPDEEGDIEYPVTMTFYGKYDNPNISITDVHLNEQEELYIDGINEADGKIERGFQVYPEHYSWTLSFLAVVLGFKN